jgi:hypothetical protein
MAVKNPLAHALASRLRRLIPYCFQVRKFGSLLIENCRGFIFDVEEVTWHRWPPVCPAA